MIQKIENVSKKRNHADSPSYLFLQILDEQHALRILRKINFFNSDIFRNNTIVVIFISIVFKDLSSLIFDTVEIRVFKEFDFSFTNS